MSDVYFCLKRQGYYFSEMNSHELAFSAFLDDAILFHELQAANAIKEYFERVYERKFKICKVKNGEVEEIEKRLP